MPFPILLIIHYSISILSLTHGSSIRLDQPNSLAPNPKISPLDIRGNKQNTSGPSMQRNQSRSWSSWGDWRQYAPSRLFPNSAIAVDKATAVAKLKLASLIQPRTDPVAPVADRTEPIDDELSDFTLSDTSSQSSSNASPLPSYLFESPTNINRSIFHRIAVPAFTTSQPPPDAPVTTISRLLRDSFQPGFVQDSAMLTDDGSNGSNDKRSNDANHVESDNGSYLYFVSLSTTSILLYVFLMM